ncbi:hypothetical protein DIPPA_35221 [Diplonema papillatum]|nr:hypothetical protein DIPPA_35221 [Diplonema papillatum]
METPKQDRPATEIDGCLTFSQYATPMSLEASPLAPRPPSNTPLLGIREYEATVPEMGTMSFSHLDGTETPARPKTEAINPKSDPSSPTMCDVPANTPLVPTAAPSFPNITSVSPSQFSSPPAASKLRAGVCSPGSP